MNREEIIWGIMITIIGGLMILIIVYFWKCFLSSFNLVKNIVVGILNKVPYRIVSINKGPNRSRAAEYSEVLDKRKNQVMR